LPDAELEVYRILQTHFDLVSWQGCSEGAARWRGRESVLSMAVRRGRLNA
jgi:hypothetical protein